MSAAVLSSFSAVLSCSIRQLIRPGGRNYFQKAGHQFRSGKYWVAHNLGVRFVLTYSTSCCRVEQLTKSASTNSLPPRIQYTESLIPSSSCKATGSPNRPILNRKAVAYPGDLRLIFRFSWRRRNALWKYLRPELSSFYLDLIS